MKKHFSKLIALLVAVLMICSALACSAVDSNPTIGKVGKVKLDLNMYYSRYQNYAQYLSYGVSGATIAAQIKNELIVYGVALDKCYKLGFDKFTDEEIAEIDAQLDESIKSVLEGYKDKIDKSITDPTEIYNAEMKLFKAELKKNGMSYKAYVKSIRNSLEENYMLDKLRAYSDAEITITDDDIDAFIQEQSITDMENYQDPEKILDFYSAYTGYQQGSGMIPLYNPENIFFVKHLLVKYSSTKEDAAVPTGGAQGKNGVWDLEGFEKITEVMNYLKSEEATLEGFEELIAEKGEDEGMKQDGFKDTGYIMNENFISKYSDGFGYAAMKLYFGRDWEPAEEEEEEDTENPGEETENPGEETEDPTETEAPVESSEPDDATDDPNGTEEPGETNDPNETEDPDETGDDDEDEPKYTVGYFTVKDADGNDVTIVSVETTYGIHFIVKSGDLTPGHVTINTEGHDDPEWVKIKEYRTNSVLEEHYNENLKKWQSETKIKFNERYLTYLETQLGLTSTTTSSK